jgi:SAM-dependent methyltransferase
MLAIAAERASGAPCPVRFAVGDARALDEPDGSFDAARSERTLQWLDDPRAAVDELARVLRPGGRLSLIDTDWSTLDLRVDDDEGTAVVHAAMQTERGRPSHVGRHLGDLVRAAGFHDVDETCATQIVTRWDPDHEPAPAGFFSMPSLADDLVDSGHLDPTDADRFVATILDAARRNHFSLGVTMHAVVGAAPIARETPRT